MSFLSSSFNPLSVASSSTSHIEFKPAALSYFTIFCPALTPPRSHDDEGKPNDDKASEAAQMLFYTSRTRAASKDRMLRQIGVAKGMVEFCSMVSSAPSTSTSSPNMSWNVHSSKRRMVLVQVKEGLWVHASIDLPQTIQRDSVSGKASKMYHDSLLADEWLEESITRAWRDWYLLNGSPGHIVTSKQGRASLERSLEKYFSVWAWSWDLETASSVNVADQDSSSAGQSSILEECVEGFPIVSRAPRSKIARLMRSDAVKQLRANGKRELVILSDTSILWPPSNAGCLDSEDEDSEEVDRQSDKATLDRESLYPQTKAELLRRVVSHLTGLEKERDLVRATAVSTLSEGRKRGTSGAIRNRSTAHGNVNGKNKRDIRTGLGLANRVVSNPVTQQRSTSTSSTASSTLNDSNIWSNWGGVFGGLGKLTFRGGDSPKRSSTPVIEIEGVASPILQDAESQADISMQDAPELVQSEQAVVVAPAKDSVASSEVAGPFQLIQQRLSEAVPIAEAGSKMFIGAEVAFKGIGASLGFGSGSPSDGCATNVALHGDEVSDLDRFADASVDTGDASADADADASIITKVSILEPDVDINELAAALSTDDVEDEQWTQHLDKTEPVLDVLHEAIEPKSPTSEQADKILVQTMPTVDGNSSVDSGWIRTGSSAKAFPSISVTSAAWYNAKIQRPDASETSPSPSPTPKFVSIEGPFNKRKSFAELPTTKAGKNTQTDVDVADTSTSMMSFQSDHHDFELDGWGDERPIPFQTFRCHVEEDEELLSYEGSTSSAVADAASKRHRVFFTSRRLLTLVLIERDTESSATSDPETLDATWQLLRRLQRILNDYERASKAKMAEEEATVKFLHLDGLTQTYQSSLESPASNLDRDVLSVAEFHCLSAMALMKRHDILETFSRSTSGKSWTASRQNFDTKAHKGDNETSRPNQTFMVQTGKNISIVDCDYELRRLANVYPSFGI